MTGNPFTGTGDAPVAKLVIDLPTPNPETVADYMAWVKFRTESLNRWVKMDAPETAPIILETIARLEGDLQQLRHLVKAEKDTTNRTDEILSHLTAFSIEALDKIADATGPVIITSATLCPCGNLSDGASGYCSYEHFNDYEMRP